MTKRRYAVAAVTLALALGAGSRPAEAEVIERVVAVVNEDAIFLSELRRRASPFLSQALAAPSQSQRMAAIEQLYQEILGRMIEEELFIQAADAMQVSVSNAEVERAIGNVRNQSGLSEAQFWQAVRQQGFGPEQYRTDVRRQLLRLKVLNHRARGRVNITEDQVRERYDELVARSNRTAQFHAWGLFFPLEAGASATEVAAARRSAEEARADVGDLQEFQAYGASDLGTLSQGDLPSEFEDALMGVDEGEMTPVIRGPSGYVVFWLVERGQASSELPPYEQVRMEIYQQMMGQEMERQEELFITELRRQAVIDLRL